MDDPKLWTAEESEKLSPSERNEIIRDGIVTDMDEVPDVFLARLRANVLDHIERDRRGRRDGQSLVLSEAHIAVWEAAWIPAAVRQLDDFRWAFG